MAPARHFLPGKKSESKTLIESRPTPKDSFIISAGEPCPALWGLNPAASFDMYKSTPSAIRNKTSGYLGDRESRQKRLKEA